MHVNAINFAVHKRDEIAPSLFYGDESSPLFGGQDELTNARAMNAQLQVEDAAAPARAQPSRASAD